jgi:hypothetical protein
MIRASLAGHIGPPLLRKARKCGPCCLKGLVRKGAPWLRCAAEHGDSPDAELAEARAYEQRVSWPPPHSSRICRQLVEYEAIREGCRPGRRGPRLALEAGISHERAMIAFWEDLSRR